MRKIDVLIVAAGTGDRLGRGEPKAFVSVGGRPMLAWSLGAIGGRETLGRVVVAGPPAFSERTVELVERYGPAGGARVVAGGETRQRSVSLGLEALEDESEYVLVHDAARPCLRRTLVDRLVEALSAHDAVVPAVPVADTLVREVGGTVDAVLDRVRIAGAQTPQAFRTDLLVRAHRRAESRGFESSDDASLVFALGEPVHVVAGDPDNFKVTFPGDLEMAEAVLRARGGD